MSQNASPALPRVESRCARLSFGKFPLEIVEMILSEVAASDLPACAAVCTQWQYMVESRTFKTLTIDPGDIIEFGQIMDRNVRSQAYVKDVVLIVPLLDNLYFNVPEPPFDGDEDLQGEEFADAAKRLECNSIAFTKAVAGLFEVLCQWDAGEIFKINKSGLSLELATQCRGENGDLAKQKGLSMFHQLGFHSTRKYLGNRERLSEVEVVTSFRILRNYFGDLEKSTRLELMELFPNLRHVSFERWQWDDSFWSLPYPLDSFCAHLSSWSRSLKRKSIFQALDQEFCEDTDAQNNEVQGEEEEEEGEEGEEAEPEDEIADFEGDRKAARIKTFHNLARRCRKLEELSVCNVIDAEEFFDAFTARKMFQTRPEWDNLGFLTLTTLLIDQHPLQIPYDRLNRLLQLIGKLVADMPAIRVFELFNAHSTEAGLFQLLVTTREATIRWTSTWPFQIDYEVRRAWEMATINGRFHPKFLPVERITEYRGTSDFIATRLLTRAIVLHPSTIMDLTGSKTFKDPLIDLGLKSTG